jgi:hypothetical protein
MPKHMLMLEAMLIATAVAWVGWGTPQALAQRARVPQTGQTQCWDAPGTPITCTDTGQDGDIQAGVVWPTPRFTNNRNGTVTDKLTGLIWLKNANCFPGAGLGILWQDAIDAANALASGRCDLTDGSVAGDWRLPNVKELLSLIDYGQFEPAVPAGHPFANLQSEYFYAYWSSTANWANSHAAWIVFMQHGDTGYSGKSFNTFLVWPVRGGQ